VKNPRIAASIDQSPNCLGPWKVEIRESFRQQKQLEFVTDADD
jgi:hypothetical protein